MSSQWRHKNQLSHAIHWTGKRISHTSCQGGRLPRPDHRLQSRRRIDSRRTDIAQQRQKKAAAQEREQQLVPRLQVLRWRQPTLGVQVRLAGLTLSRRRLLLPLVSRPLVARAVMLRAAAWLLAQTELRVTRSRAFPRVRQRST